MIQVLNLVETINQNLKMFGDESKEEVEIAIILFKNRGASDWVGES